MSDPAARRRKVRALFAVLVVLHAGAFLGYVKLTREQAHRQLFLEARDEWAAGHLATAADEYRAFLAGYAAASRPVVLSRHFPAASGAWFALGRIEAERRRVDAALAAFREAMAADPGLGRREYRDLLFESGRYAALEAFAGEELAREPGSLAAAYDLGAALYAGGRPAAAAEAYEEGLARVPAYLAAHDPGYHGGLSEHEARLANLASVAHLAAGDVARATALCAGIARRSPPRVSVDRLCRAALAARQGDAAGVRAALAGYLPPGPEEGALVARLVGAAPSG